MKKITLAAALFTALTAHAQITIAIDSDAPEVPVSSTLYGIFYEDINHAADGGLYAELIRNRSFEDAATPDFWTAFPTDESAKLSIATDDLLNDAQKQCLHVETSEGESGVANCGFWGINAVKGQTYSLALWIKVKRGAGFRAAIVSSDGKNVYAAADLDVNPKAKGWQKVTAELVPDANDNNAQLAIISSPADYRLDVVSLFPPTFKNRANGLRPDLAEMLQELHPAFMRFPGGCFVEGQGTPDNAFRWQRTVGPIEERVGHENKNWGYRTSDGLGFHEFLQLAEDIGAAPLYVCNIGIWHGGITPLEDIQPWIDECLAAIEYANGPATSKYGAMRAANGHPAPFGLEFIEVGNENNQDDGAQTSDHYYERYEAFREAILAVYPEMKIIGNVAAWGTDSPTWHGQPAAELVDEHYYRSPQWFASNFEKYDAYDRARPAVYCGEYAVTQGFGATGNLNAALGEAVYMMGFENNGDIVKMSSYAPIFVNVNDCRWMPDMIRFDNRSAMGTPSYYVQKLFADNRPAKALKLSEGKRTLFPVDSSITPEESAIGLATWNTQATFADIAIIDENGEVVASGTDAADFRPLPESWQTVSEGIAQTERTQGIPAMLVNTAKGTKYSVRLRARKDGGDEGFIIVFNAGGQDYYWLTIGSCRNSCHVVERGTGGWRATVKSVEGRVETGHWYDIRLDVDGNKMAAYLDGEKIIETELFGDVLPGIFASAALDETGDEMILKIVNTSDTAETANLQLADFQTVGGTLTQLKAADGMAENTLDNPTNVYPTTKRISLDAAAPQFVIPPFSLNILRLERQ
ncbi:MAG: carbohydrate binding domain-containing protein [Prevotella sp.]|nr:carbohydrate binding domain-containing protein [Prevotella sp.]